MANKHSILAELNKRKKEAEKPKFDFDKFCFPAQQKFFRGSDIRFKVAVCSRRSGKSVGIAADMMDTASTEKNVNILYITQTRGAAKAIIWSEVLKIIEDNEMDCKIDHTTLTVIFRNGSKVYLAGAKDRNEVSKFRGYKLRKTYIDEAQSIRPSILTELINDVIIPALRDLRGALYLTGTPGPVSAGPYFEYSQSKDWDSQHWDAFDNPFMHDPPLKDLNITLQEERIIRNIDETDPSYIRETFGKWVEDEDSLVFKFDKKRNIYENLPQDGEWTYVVGVDIGFNDSDSIAVLGYNSFVKKVFLIEEFEKNKQNISELVKEIRRVKNKYDPTKIVMDAGALGKKIQEEIRTRHGIHIEAAEKSRKVEFIELLNDDLRTSKLLMPENSIFEEDSRLVTWDKDSILSNPEKPKVSSAYHSDICDAVLYAWRESRHYLSEKPVPDAKVGTNQYMDELEEKEAAKMERRKEDPAGADLEEEWEKDCDELSSILDVW